MNVQLYLENELVELDDSIKIPLNKTFDDIQDPTKIVVDYSKSINIPMTKYNNSIFGNIYRLDKTIVNSGDNVNIGIYFDPSKKIPFKLLYNYQLILTGYAKFLSASYSENNAYYTITLYSTLGDVFKKLQSVTTSKRQLGPGLGNEYILDDLLSGSAFNRNIVSNSWSYVQEIQDIYNNAKDEYIVGFMPSYRGYYENDFSSDKAQWTNPDTNTDEILPLVDILKYYWKKTYKLQNPSATDEQVTAYIDGLDAEGIIGDGFKDYQMNCIRSYESRPYFVFSSLMQLYQHKCKELTGYDLLLDPDFFNNNNPYYSKMCYTLDFFDTKASNEVQKKVFDGDILPLTKSSNTGFPAKLLYSIDTISATIEADNSPIIRISPFTISNKVSAPIGVNGGTFAGIVPFNDFANRVEITIAYLDGTIVHNKVMWLSPDENFNFNTFGGNANDLVIRPTNWKTYPNNGQYPGSINATFTIDYDIPEIVIDNTGGEGVVEIRLDVGYQFNTGTYMGLVVPKNEFYPQTQTIYPTLNAVNKDAIIISPIDINANWRDNISMNIGTFYQREEPLFNAIIQYTKMFGLVWDVDETNQVINIKTRNNFFKNFTISDWSDRVDRSKNMTIEPVSFDTRFVTFGYNELDGYNLTSYTNKTGEVYGVKRMNTGYEFNTDTKQVIDNLYPTSTSNRSFIRFEDLVNWDLTSVIRPRLAPYVMIDCDDKSGDRSSVASNWILKTGLLQVDDLTSRLNISDDTSLMRTSGEYCHTYNSGDYINSPIVPIFDVAINTNNDGYICCLMSTPTIDYTSSKNITKALGNCLYDRFWDTYINERYNIQNKKITLYLNIKVNDYLNFKFNNFIIIENQLFMINKIIDFDPSVTDTTKCELIQITDTNAYINSQKIIK